MIQLNAQLLELLEEDKQKFQQYFIEQKLFTTLSDLLEKEKHDRFSLLMQQLVMGLPVESIIQAEPEIAHWVDQLLPIISIPSHTKQVNALRQKLIQGVLIVAQYDLLILTDDKAIIINWTRDRNIPPGQLESIWKTQLQLFLLAETEEILPNHMSLISCFVNSGTSPTLHQSSYNHEKHDFLKQRLKMALSNLPSSLINDSEYSFHNHLDEAQLNLQRLLNGEMTNDEYLKTIPEVEI